MALFYFHRVLIGSTVLFALFFIWFCVSTWQAQGGAIHLVMAGVSVLIAAAMVLYLAHFNRHMAEHRKKIALAAASEAQ